MARIKMGATFATDPDIEKLQSQSRLIYFNMS